MQIDEFASYKTQIDLTVYSNKWFRLPNQTNKDKPFEHKIVNGKMKDFLIHRIKSTTCKVEHKEQTNERIDFIDDDENPIMNEIKTMVTKMTNYFDKFDEWSKLGFIIWNETKGSNEGLELYNEVSKQFQKYDAKALNKLWYGIKGKETTKLTIKTLRMWYNKLFPLEATKINDIFSNASYLKQKPIFEKRIFKLDEPFNFVKINAENTMELMNLKSLKEWS